MPASCFLINLLTYYNITVVIVNINLFMLISCAYIDNIVEHRPQTRNLQILIASSQLAVSLPHNHTLASFCDTT